MKKIGFTGSRHGMTPKQRQKLKELLSKSNFAIFHHGDCVGSDAEAHDIVRSLSESVKITVHPPKDETLRAFKKGDNIKHPLGYLSRDRKIVENCDVLIATPSEKSKGTWYTVDYARQLKKPICIIFENGAVKFVNEGEKNV